MAVDIQLKPTRGLDGVLTLRGSGGEVVIDDELWHHVMHLARAAADLAAGHAAAVPYSGLPGGYELTPEGDDVVISGDHVAPVRFVRAELIAAVMAAADRWIASARASGDGEQATLADDVAAAVAAARAAMSS